MLLVTKVFRFETAHAIHQHQGLCKNIHGHSYELHVTIAQTVPADDYLPDQGILFDFKDLKKIVTQSVIDSLDHKLIISTEYLKAHPGLYTLENLEVWSHEPTAENILIFVKNNLQKLLPTHILVWKLKIYETVNSYAEWMHEDSKG